MRSVLDVLIHLPYPIASASSGVSRHASLHILFLTRDKANTAPQRPQTATVSDKKTTTQARTFNTSRALKQVNDNSTIDFTYLPAMTYTSYDDEIRVPLIHSTSAITTHEVVDGQVHRPLITTASEDASHVSASNALAETKHEGLGEMFEDVQVKAKEMMKEPEKITGFFATMWNGVVDDIFGKKVAKMVKV